MPRQFLTADLLKGKVSGFEGGAQCVQAVLKAQTGLAGDLYLKRLSCVNSANAVEANSSDA